MRSIIKRTIYTGLGMLSAGADAVNDVSSQLAKKANVSESEGARIARKLEQRSAAAASKLRKVLDAEVTRVADAIHSAIRADVEQAKKSRGASPRKAGGKKSGKSKGSA